MAAMNAANRRPREEQQRSSDGAAMPATASRHKSICEIDTHGGIRRVSASDRFSAEFGRISRAVDRKTVLPLRTSLRLLMYRVGSIPVIPQDRRHGSCHLQNAAPESLSRDAGTECRSVVELARRAASKRVH